MGPTLCATGMNPPSAPAPPLRVGSQPGTPQSRMGGGVSPEHWPTAWRTQKMLIRLAQGKGKKPQQTAEVWKAFERLHLPYGDMNFIRRALWAKLPVAERLQAWTKNALCEMCGVPENHRHVYGHCKYIPYALDVVSKTFFPCKGADGTPLDPTTILADHPLISLTTTQGLVIWAAVLSSWSLRCS